MPVISNNSVFMIHMKNMITLASENRTVVSRDMTVWTTSVEWDTTDSADIIVWDIPFPYGNCVDSFYLDFHQQTKGRTLTTSDNERPDDAFLEKYRFWWWLYWIIYGIEICMGLLTQFVCLPLRLAA